MALLDWLAERRFRRCERREHARTFSFDGRAYLTVECLWRLLKDGRIALTNEDDGQRFGRNEPIDAVAEINRCLATAAVDSVTLREGTLDLQLQFSGGYVLEVLPSSSGYEAWNAGDGTKRFIALGGGGMHSCDD